MDLLEIISFLIIISFLLCRLLFLISCRILVSMLFWAFDKIKYLPVTLGIIRNDRTPDETANNVGGESSSTSETLSSSPKWKYHAVLSFAHFDYRGDFIRHLYDALKRGGINVRQFNSHQIHQGIKDSLCAVVVLSKNYAQSTWCLEELQMILECRRELGQQVFPIFWDVDPWDVRHQRHNFGEALAKHQKKFERHKVRNWRNALSEIGSIPGWTTSGRHEAELIKVIVGKGSEEIEVIYMDYYWGDRGIIEIHPEAFSKMSRLRLLILWGPLEVPTGLNKLNKLPGALKFVQWEYCPFEALPLPLDELVHIDMRSSKLKQLSNGIKFMNHLKFIDLSHCPFFTETLDFSNVQSLEHLYLSWCGSLVNVHESLGVLKELVEVDLHGCYNLNSLPSKLETNSLRKLDLGWCKNVRKLPEFGEGMKKLEYLDASHTAITRLPESLGSLTGLRELNLSATGLINLPSDGFSNLFELVLLSLAGCESLESLPRLPPRLIRLEAGGCYSMKRSLDEQMLNLVTSLDHEFRGQTKFGISDDEEKNMPHCQEYFLPFELKDVESEYLPLRNFFAIMPSGGIIPSWFDPNCKYYDEARDECEIEVDVPPNFHASKWSGIVVCLHMKGDDSFISWGSKAPEDDEYNIWEERGFGRLHGDGLGVMVLEFNEETCWQHLRGDNYSLHIQLSSHKCPAVMDGDIDPVILEILGYGWRVICKEDIQKWSRVLGISVKPQMCSAASPPSSED